MQEIIPGIYKITNKTTGEFYIGCSTNIYRRWSSHRTRYKEKTSKEYNKKLYVSMREYGIDNFDFEIVEVVYDIETLFNVESAYIKNLKAYENGLNEGQCGESHGKAKLSASDVVDIRERYGLLESKRNVYLDYQNNISESGFHKVWNGYTWPNIMMEVYTPENRLYHKNDTGSPAELNPRTKLSNKEVISIRDRKKHGENKRAVYNDYSDKISFGSFSNVWYGYNWKVIA